MSQMIGIDLGTSTSSVAVWVAKGVEDAVQIIDIHQRQTIDSYVAFLNKDNILVGNAAKAQAYTNPTNTVFDAKRLIGRGFSDDTVQRDIEQWPFKVIADERDNPKIVVNIDGKEKQFSPEEIYSKVLNNLKEAAASYLRTTIDKVDKVVIAIPAYFTHSQRRATIDAATLSGFKEAHLINEPTASAIAYEIHNKASASGNGLNVFVFDLGAGTLDISVLTIRNGTTTVKATAGDDHLGGANFDNLLVKYCLDEFKKEKKLDISTDPTVLGLLKKVCEDAKIELSSSPLAYINIGGIQGTTNFSRTITREKFDEINDTLYKRCWKAVDKCLGDAEMKSENIDEVIIVGASSQIPKIQSYLADKFKGKELNDKKYAREAVARGAAIKAAALSGLLPNDLNISDVTPLSLGIEIIGDIISTIVPRNTHIPTKKEKVFTTTVDNQTSILFKVYQGERPKSTDNRLLGQFTLSGIRPANRGIPKINVIFSLNFSGIMKVSASDMTTGEKRDINVTAQMNTLTKEELARMGEDANKFKLRDAEFKKKMEAKNALESYAYEIRNAVRGEQTGARLDPGSKHKIEDAFKETIEWLERNGSVEAEAYDSKRKNLENLWNPIKARIN